MQTIPTPPEPIAGYGLSMPDEAYARAALVRVFGADAGERTWSEACRAAGLAAGQVFDAERLERVVAAVAGRGGPAEVVARSITLRIRTHTTLAALRRAAGGQA